MEKSLHRPNSADYVSMTALNNEFSIETSLMSEAAIQALVASAFYARITSKMDAFCVALDQDAKYDNVNFNWFAGRYLRFVYVDRIVVARRARGRGIASAMYGDLIVEAKKAGSPVLCCEVNVDPPNPASDRFHERFGFKEVGRVFQQDRCKVVRYLVLDI